RIAVTFYRINGTALDPGRTSTSEWVGTSTGGGEFTLDSDGVPIVGLYGCEHSMGLGLGLILARAPSARPQGARRPPKALPKAPVDEVLEELIKPTEPADDPPPEPPSEPETPQIVSNVTAGRGRADESL